MSPSRHPPSPSPSLSPTVAYAPTHRRSRFPLPSPTLPLSSATLPPTVALASSHRRPRFLPPLPSLPPTVALASSHRRPRFLPPSPSLPPTVALASSHRRPPFSPTSLHVVITPLPITFPLFTIASPPMPPTLSSLPIAFRVVVVLIPYCLVISLMLSPLPPFLLLPSPMVTTPPLHPYFLLILPPHQPLTHPGRGGGDEALEQSVGGTARAARAGGQQRVQYCRGRVRGAGEAGMRERGCRDPSIPLIPCHTFTSCPPPLLRSVVPPQPSSSPSPFLPSSISLPHYPLYPLCCPSSLPTVLPSSCPPFLPSSLPVFLPLLILPRCSPPYSFHLPLSLSLPHANPAPPLHPSTQTLVPSRTFSSHPPIISSPHHLIPPSSHPPIISSPHYLIRPSSHPPIISSPHHLIRPSSHPPIISSAHHLIRPSSHPPIILSPHHLIPPSSHPPIISSSRDEYRV
ncbi:unnamed protein product [Closterium sp. NIES-65]|nr:unnamed protein product [Closterium sp. NIES-65]